MTYITFEEVKDILKCSIDETKNMNEAIERTLQRIYIKGYTDALESKWIPVNERFPNKGEYGKVFVTYIPSGGTLWTTVMTASYSDLMGIAKPSFHIGEVGKESFQNITEQVIAWMPLPKPYKAESNVPDINDGELISRQPEKRTEERTETRACNCISRQAAIDTIGNVSDHNDGMVWEALSHAQRDVALLPLVTPQPEIIRCKDCKYSSPNGKYGCKSYHYRLYETHEMKPDDFCSRAERRTHE